MFRNAGVARMSLIRCLPIAGARDARLHLKRVGVDADGIPALEGRTFHLNLQMEGVSSRTAILLKQEMLSLGGDAVVNTRVFDCSVDSTDVILTGTLSQIEALNFKLTGYPDLASFAVDLRETLDGISKSHFVVRCRKKTFTLGTKTLLMGVLNVTPDSFSDGGLFFDKEKAVARGLKMADEGADMIDIGGESTRPGSKPLELDEELRRVIPVIESLAARVEAPISIDTYKSSVAGRAIDAGAQVINDISGLNFDPDLARIAAGAEAPLILMHIRGIPETMQRDVRYGSLFSEILHSLKRSVEKAEAAGVAPGQIIVDPGIGFGKNLEDNLLLIRNLSEFSVLGKPILLGTSRKSFIGKLLGGADAAERLEGTLASTVIGIMNGAHIVRCHDVRQAKRAITIADAIRFAGTQGQET
jgi:dihydropteroate synthase